jgi:NAD(P)-dependent dehydrogenase (short-subunit alcohol dehydrogenase family)
LGTNIILAIFQTSTTQIGHYSKWDAYAQSKLANLLFARVLNQKLQVYGGAAFSVNPGPIMTGLQKNLSDEEMIAMGWKNAAGKFHDVFKTSEYGAATSIYAAVDNDALKYAGRYLEDCGLSTDFSLKSQDDELAQLLWKLSEEMTETI